MIEMRKLKQLIRLMKDNDLSEIDLRDQDEQVTLKRQGGAIVPQVSAPPPAAPAPAAQPVAPVPGEAPRPDPAAEGLIEVPSPMVGTFYGSPSPDADPFVRVGSSVQPDTVVCIIEAMKVFNEIRAEVSGTIEKVLVSNGQAVEFGQAMYLVRPD